MSRFTLVFILTIIFSSFIFAEAPAQVTCEIEDLKCRLVELEKQNQILQIVVERLDRENSEIKNELEILKNPHLLYASPSRPDPIGTLRAEDLKKEKALKMANQIANPNENDRKDLDIKKLFSPTNDWALRPFQKIETKGSESISAERKDSEIKNENEAKSLYDDDKK